MLEKEIFTINTPEDFENIALKIFKFQYENINVYRRFCDFLKINPKAVKKIEKIPFLPIRFFKSHTVIAQGISPEIIFSSSGTTGTEHSKHTVAKLNLYETSFFKTFENRYGKSSELTILALLPSYLEREGSSLIYMVDFLIKKTENPNSGFYLNTTSELIQKLEVLEKKNSKTLLIGVSYALLDLIEINKFQLKNTIVMETGGMKGRRKEMVREELHEILKKGFGVSEIHSEYGMTELLSQAYSKGDGIFTCPPWMKILTREPEDSLAFNKEKTGGINVIDLANLYSCSFIATDDLGKLKKDGTFEILGRFDSSDVRGCNLMVL